MGGPRERDTRLLDDEAMCTFASMAGFHSELHICPLVPLSLNDVRRESSRIIASALLFGLSLDELVLRQRYRFVVQVIRLTCCHTCNLMSSHGGGTRTNFPPPLSPSFLSSPSTANECVIRVDVSLISLA